MIYLIIGHRGTGKSEWLKIISSIHKEKNKDVLCFDLDKEVEKSSRRSIQDIFKEGEDVFRNWEQKIFKKIIQSIPKKQLAFIAVGAGFQPKQKKDFKVIFLCRNSDKNGRIFFNRPHLSSDKESIEEYFYFYNKRHNFYLEQKDEVFYRMEHFKEPHLSDYLFFKLESLKEDLFSLRVPSLNKKDVFNFFERRKNWGIRFFELHDSNANEDLINEVSKVIPKNKILFSSQCNTNFKSIKDKINWSWDLKLGEPPREATILSLHERGSQSFKNLLKEFSKYKKYHLKLSVEIFNLKELWEAYEWYKEDPKNRSFLPRSSTGKWKWFRMAFAAQMFLSFIREGESDIQDQPLFCEAVHHKEKSKQFAGVLGSPIEFSKTPKEHNSFFYQERSIPVLSVLMEEDEMNKDNMDILKKMGFVFFAITSPLKQKAFECADVIDKILENIKSVNTFILNSNKWYAYNTDQEGLKEFLPYSKQKVVIWGGGGIRRPLQACLPKASFYSARKGKPIQDKPFCSKEVTSPDILIWAVGAHRIKQGCLFPSCQWQPSQVIDLNYMENSPGREYAKKIGASYKNGEAFFRKQAEKQREFYLQQEEK